MRCLPTRQIDGNDGLVRFDIHDKLCLDGRRLIQTDSAGVPLAFPQSEDAKGLSGTASREYRLESDPTVRVRAYQSAFNDQRYGPKYFELRTADGRVRTYGQAPYLPAQANASAAGNYPGATHYVWAWGLGRDQDSAGNIIDYNYEALTVHLPPGRTADAYEWVLKSIEYGTNATAGAAGKVTVTLDYSLDNHPADAHIGGNRRAFRRYLTSVEAAVSGASTTLISRLGYVGRPRTGRSLLQSIRECSRPSSGGTEKCLPGRTFSYTLNSAVNFVEDTSWARDAAGNSNGLSASPMFKSSLSGGSTLQGDFNGDGRPDLLIWVSGLNQLFLSEGSGNYRKVQPGTGPAKFNIDVTISSSDALRKEYCRLPMVADFDGDGLDDLALFAPQSTAMGCSTFIPGQGRT